MNNYQNSSVYLPSSLDSVEQRLQVLVGKFDEYINCSKSSNENLYTGATTVSVQEPVDDYDYNGAIAYIIIITLFYSISVLAIIRIQTKKRTDFYDYDDEDEYSGHKPESVLRGMKNENITRQALEDLRDPTIRNKLWDIYEKDRVKKPTSNAAISEQNRLKAIDKKLKILYKDSPLGEYHQRTIDNSSFSTSPRRASILPTKQNTHENALNKKSRIHHANSDPSNAPATPPLNPTTSPSKTGRFQVENVDETKV